MKFHCRICGKEITTFGKPCGRCEWDLEEAEIRVYERERATKANLRKRGIRIVVI